MALLRAHVTDEYWAEYAVLVIRDRGGDAGFDSMELLAEFATECQPGGTIAMAGAGWLWARASSPDGDNAVRLEAHGSAPPDDLADWHDVLETPYLSFSGTVGLALLTGADDDGHTLRLGPAGQGHYRVRVSCRRQPAAKVTEAPDDGTREGDTWRLQFWPASGDPEPPRWLARAPAVIDESPAWGDGMLDPHVRSVLWSARRLAGKHPEGVSAAQIAADRAAIESAFAGQADPASPLWPPAPRPPLTKGHPDLDAFDARAHAQLVAEWAERKREVAELAARIGMPVPVTVGDVLPLLVRMGLLSVSGDGAEPRYRLLDPPAAQDTMREPPDTASGDEDEDEPYHGSADEAADLVAVALWAREGQVGTVADLAERLLMSPEEVRVNLRYAEREQLLRVVGDPRGTASRLTLTPLPRRGEPAGGPLRLADPGVAAAVQDIGMPPLTGDKPRASGRMAAASLARQAGPSPFPEGVPPRAGIVTRSGKLVIWRDGRAEVLASVPADTFRAIKTPYGTVVLSFAESVIVRPGGQAGVLATGTDYRAAVSADGRYLALSQSRFGRRPKFALHVVDVADGSRHTLRWPANLSIDGMYGGAVFFGTADAGSLRWTPGTDPEPLPWAPRTVDRLSGRMLVDGFDEDVDGWLVIGQDGERSNVLATGAAELALAGTRMMYFRYEPPAVTLFDVATGGADPRVVWLPEGSDTGTHGRAWEDSGHMLFSRPYARDSRAVRLDVRTGEIQRVPFPGVQDGLAVFVESLADPA